MSEFLLTDRRPAAAGHAAALAVGQCTGLVESVDMFLPSRDHPSYTTTQGTEPDTNYLVYGSDADEEGDVEAGGKGATARDALLTHVGEAAERYAMQWPVTASFRPFAYTSGTYEEVARSRPVVDDRYLAIHPDDQLDRGGFDGYDPGERRGWVEGVRLDTGDPTWVPAGAIGPDPETGGSLGPAFGTSNGVACGSSPEQAILGGIYEMVERDAIMRQWYTRTTPSRIDPDDLGTLSPSVEAFRSTDVRPHLLHLDVDGPFHAVVLILERLRDETPKFRISGGASLDLTAAASSALTEMVQAIQTHHYPIVKDEPTPELDDVSTFGDAVTFYAEPANFDLVRWLIRDNPSYDPPSDRRRYDDERAELRAAVEGLDARDVTPVFFDLTTPDVAQLGMTVARIVIPELVPLTMPNVAPTAHPAFDDADVITTPHPFP